MKVLLYCFIIGFTTPVFAQTAFAPDSANWNYHYSGHGPGFESDWSIKVVNDTIVDGYPTKYLERTYLVTYSLPPSPPTGTVDEIPFGVLQERNDSILYYDSYPNNGRFLYSFAMNIDDTITIDPSYPDLIAVVDTVYDTIIAGNTLSIWKLTKYCNEFGSSIEFGKTQIIEDIGPINDFLLWNTDGCPIGGGWWMFECYNSTSLSYNLPCVPIYLGTEEKKEPNISIYPNPVKTELTVNYHGNNGELFIELFGTDGLLAYSGRFTDTATLSIPTDKLSNGHYTLVIRDGEGVFRDQIVIIR